MDLRIPWSWQNAPHTTTEFNWIGIASYGSSGGHDASMRSAGKRSVTGRRQLQVTGLRILQCQQKKTQPFRRDAQSVCLTYSGRESRSGVPANRKANCALYVSSGPTSILHPTVTSHLQHEQSQNLADTTTLLHRTGWPSSRHSTRLDPSPCKHRPRHCHFQLVRTSQETRYVSATEPNRLI
jgi:hypothetical protein